ncbi:MAG: SipW-dependent-type signal peptide-containing protein [Propionicimonas sp.]|uniref:SipW-dependent-type signal peptide-containing protein n=1 Tax=Propionicimonas sp. TaxID=1955623 RepID=UPI003D0A753D
MKNTTETTRRRGRKVAAVLAGGLVLGVGTMATLASWNDAEFASASFKAGAFNLEGSVDQSTFSEHATEGTAGSLSFGTTYNNLQPGDSVYSGYAIRLDKNSTYSATAVVSPGTFAGSTTGLSYTLFTTGTAGCSASSTSTGVIVAAGTALNSVGTPGSISLAKSTNVGTSAGATVYLCFKVTADTNLVQGQTAAPIWKFTATSGAS